MRGLVRLQSADLRFAARLDSTTGVVTLSKGKVTITGGTEMTFAATGNAAALSGQALLAGRLTALDLGWRNDGRLLRPVMEMLGERLVDGAKSNAAVEATRRALLQHLGNLPATALVKGSDDELGQMAAALPQGRGWFALSLVAADGIGAVELLMAGLKDDPVGPDALAQLLAGAQLAASWAPGLAP